MHTTESKIEVHSHCATAFTYPNSVHSFLSNKYSSLKSTTLSPTQISLIPRIQQTNSYPNIKSNNHTKRIIITHNYHHPSTIIPSSNSNNNNNQQEQNSFTTISSNSDSLSSSLENSHLNNLNGNNQDPQLSKFNDTNCNDDLLETNGNVHTHTHSDINNDDDDNDTIIPSEESFQLNDDNDEILEDDVEEEKFLEKHSDKTNVGYQSVVGRTVREVESRLRDQIKLEEKRRRDAKNAERNEFIKQQSSLSSSSSSPSPSPSLSPSSTSSTSSLPSTLSSSTETPSPISLSTSTSTTTTTSLQVDNLEDEQPSENEELKYEDEDEDEEEGEEEEEEEEEDDILPLSERMRLEGHKAELEGGHLFASQLYSRAVALDPQNGKAWQNYSKAEGKRKRSMKASAAILRKAVKENPSNPYLWQSLGFILFRMRKYDDARMHFQIGIERDGNHAPLYSTWAHLEFAIKNVSKARYLYEKGTRLGEGSGRVYHNWGQMELKLGNEQRALELFQTGLEYDPHNPFIWETLGTYAWKKEKNYRKARKCYLNALKSDKVNTVVYMSWAKLEGYFLNNILKARKIFQIGYDCDPRDSRLLHNWSKFEFKVKNLELAKKLIEKAVLLTPADSVLWTQFAKIEQDLRHYPRARAMFNRACEINPKDWKAWDAWSVMEHNLGNFQQSEKLLHESFRVRFNAKGDFSILANSLSDRIN